MMHARALSDVTAAFQAFRPPRRVPISVGAAENLEFKQIGIVPGKWSAEKTPYMVEPMDMLASREHEAVVFMGPARTGKTAALLLGWMAHNVVNDPGDMLFLQMTQDKAREFSKTDVDRAITHSKSVKAMMGGTQADNTHDKMFRHGMWLRIAWPTVPNVSGSTYRYVAITDGDRMTNFENVDGEGPLFKLALKRTQTYGSRGMCLVESSPGIELLDPHWQPVTRHEAPPATGVCGIYNQSDRRRLYWNCEHCHEWFEPKPGLGLFNLPSEDVLLEIVREADIEAIATEHNRIVCPMCNCLIGPRAKKIMNQSGRWLRDGQQLTKRGELVGRGIESSIAGYWMGGIPAAYQSWRSLVLRYLQGLRDYVLTNSEQTLKTTTTNDQGTPYMSMRLRKASQDRLDPKSRKDKTMERYVIPEGGRVLIATVDIQDGLIPSFVVQVHAVGKHREKWIIDRFKIVESRREGADGGFAPLDPSKYAEDWDRITEEVMRKTYRTHIPGLELRIKTTVVDTGGAAGVTDRSYAWYRRVRKLGFAGRIMLVKGLGRKEAALTPMISESWLGNRNPSEKGDVPVYMLNSNKFKDIVDLGLKRTDPGPGYIHLPEWFTDAAMDEIAAEVRNDDGTWTQLRKRNETFDLLYYCESACLRLGLDKIDWNNPPQWAAPVAENSERISREDRRDLQENEPLPNAELLKEDPLKVVEQVRAQIRNVRRMTPSSYLSG